METGMTTLLTSFGEIITAVTGWIGSVAAAVIAEPILLLPFGLGVLGVVVGLFKKFAH